MQLSFGEAGEKKHVIILDSDKNSVEYIENTFSPKHIYVKDSELSSLQESDLKNNFVCILTEESNQFEDKRNMNKVIEDLKASSVQVKKQNKKADSHAITDAKLLVADQDKLLERYVEQVENVNLSKDKLLQVGLEIVRKAADEKD